MDDVTSEWELFVDGLDFGEGPRWHDGRLWYSDFYQSAIYSVAEDGTRRVEFSSLPDQPSGLGWMPDGTLLVVFMNSRQIMRVRDGVLVVHADLSGLISWPCNDMVVDHLGNAYVGNFGFDIVGGASFAPTDLVMVRPDASAVVVASDLKMPNGSVITPDGSTLIVGETYGAGYEAWSIGTDGTLSDRRRWADVPGTYPDGCSMDAEGAIWFSDAIGRQVLRVREGGEVTHSLRTPHPTYACMLGGSDGCTLFALTAPSSHPDRVRGKSEGAIYSTRVDHPRAGRP